MPEGKGKGPGRSRSPRGFKEGEPAGDDFDFDFSAAKFPEGTEHHNMASSDTPRSAGTKRKGPGDDSEGFARIEGMLAKMHEAMEKRMDGDGKRTEEALATITTKIDGIVLSVDTKIESLDKKISERIATQIQAPLAAVTSDVDVLKQEIASIKKSSSETQVCLEKNFSGRDDVSTFSGGTGSTSSIGSRGSDLDNPPSRALIKIIVGEANTDISIDCAKAVAMDALERIGADYTHIVSGGSRGREFAFRLDGKNITDAEAAKRVGYIMSMQTRRAGFEPIAIHPTDPSQKGKRGDAGLVSVFLKVPLTERQELGGKAGRALLKILKTKDVFGETERKGLYFDEIAGHIRAKVCKDPQNPAAEGQWCTIGTIKVDNHRDPILEWRQENVARWGLQQITTDAGKQWREST